MSSKKIQKQLSENTLSKNSNNISNTSFVIDSNIINELKNKYNYIHEENIKNTAEALIYKQFFIDFTQKYKKLNNIDILIDKYKLVFSQYQNLLFITHIFYCLIIYYTIFILTTI